MWIFLSQLAIKWPFSFPSHPMFASALPRECRQSKICIEICKNVTKNFPKIIDQNFKKHNQILIIFGLNISDTTGYWMIISVTTSPNSCFCSTWGKPTKQIMCWSEWKSEWKNFNKFYPPDLWPSTASWLEGLTVVQQRIYTKWRSRMFMNSRSNWWSLD